MRLTFAVTCAALALGVVAHPADARAPGQLAAAVADPNRTEIVVRTGQRVTAASTGLLGANHLFVNNGLGSWDPLTDAPVPDVVDKVRRAGLQHVRFPGGTVANLYDWKRGIGEDRRCQADGRRVPGRGGGEPISRKLAFGVDEYMEFVAAADARPFIMMPFVTETPQDAADWVEYMNTPAGDGVNPNEGVDWAEERAANGHAAPYDVRRWEIGNEQQNGRSRYWMSDDTDKAARQYAFGGERLFSDQPLGKRCDRRPSGIPSDGKANQRFEIRYPPVRTESVRVTVDGQRWNRVDDLSAAGPDDRVFEVDGPSGTVRFGDGEHGAIPEEGADVRASYRSVHDGFFEFARRMKEVDPRIEVCSSWGERAFVRVVGDRSYDCLTTHAIVTFGSTAHERELRWDGPLEGHDSFMVSGDQKVLAKRRLVSQLKRVPLWLTEFASIGGDPKGYPHWATSASHAVFMATLWAGWMKLGIDVGLGNTMVWTSDRAMLSPRPHFTYTAEAMTREALSPMFAAGGRVVRTDVSGNPSRNGVGTLGEYRGLVTLAVKETGGRLYLLVVNRLPDEAVRTVVTLAGHRSAGSAQVRTVDSRSFRDWNKPGTRPDVRLKVTRRPIGGSSFTHTFPATSTTVLVIPSK